MKTLEISHNINQIKLTSRELNAMCPVSNDPDTYTIKVEFNPNGKTIETKSFQLYLMKYRDQFILAEELANTIHSDLFQLLNPHSLRVKLNQNIQHGIQLRIIVSEE